MRVLPLDSELEEVFWDHVDRDIPDYFFFILDIKKDRAYSDVWLALDEQSRIDGMMLLYRGSIVQLRGTVAAGEALLERLDVRKVHIQAPTEHRALVLDKYRNIKKASEIILMTLTRGEENLKAEHTPIRLSSEDAGDVATLMKRGNPDWWGETTEERIAERIDERLFLGVKVHGRLVSVGGATVEEWGGTIAPVVTHESHRNRGYATSVVSALVEQILQKSSVVLIYVESGNPPAMRVYTKVGFRPYRRYFLADAEK